MPQGQPAIAGLGITEQGKVYGRTAAQFAAEAVRLAVADAGLALGDLDGLLVSGGLGGSVGIDLQGSLGLTDLRLLTLMQGYGSTAGQMVQYAAMAVRSGTADTIAVVWADDPLKDKSRTSAAYTRRGAQYPAAGAVSAPPMASTRPTRCTPSRRGAT
jgi:acetyl-CoA acetyltransferase